MRAAQKLWIGAGCSLLGAVLTLGGGTVAARTAWGKMAVAGRTVAARPVLTDGAAPVTVHARGPWTLFATPAACQPGAAHPDGCSQALARLEDAVTLRAVPGPDARGVGGPVPIRGAAARGGLPTVVAGPGGRVYLGYGEVVLAPGRYRIDRRAGQPAVRLVPGRYSLLWRRGPGGRRPLAVGLGLLAAGLGLGAVGEVWSWFGWLHRRDDRAAAREAEWRAARAHARAAALVGAR